MSAIEQVRSKRRARRFDPGRKNRIIDATLAVIAEHGVSGTTHRRVAEAADVPLGSVTYHFRGLEDLRLQAFTRHFERGAASYESHFTSVRTRDEFIDAVTELIVENVDAGTTEWAITFELYLAALHSPELRALTERWMRTSRAVLERFVDPDVARDLDALTEGLALHKKLSTAPPTARQTRDTVARIVPPLFTNTTRN
jgi:DNA-binding transcriptional regulator YbjK